MAWQGPVGQTDGKEGIVLTMETKVCYLGRIQDVDWTCREWIRKAKAEMELSLDGMLKIIGRNSIGTLARRDRPKRAYFLWQMRKENWLLQIWRRLGY